jgi:hypothetical protein
MAEKLNFTATVRQPRCMRVAHLLVVDALHLAHAVYEQRKRDVSAFDDDAARSTLPRAQRLRGPTDGP